MIKNRKEAERGKDMSLKNGCLKSHVGEACRFGFRREYNASGRPSGENRTEGVSGGAD